MYGYLSLLASRHAYKVPLVSIHTFARRGRTKFFEKISLLLLNINKYFMLQFWFAIREYRVDITCHSPMQELICLQYFLPGGLWFLQPWASYFDINF